VEPGGSQLDIGEPAIGRIVHLELDDEVIGDVTVRGDGGHKGVEQDRVPGKSPAERGGHVVLVVTKQVEDGRDAPRMEDEVGHASRIGLRPRPHQANRVSDRAGPHRDGGR
jgi:hypothetical protein